MGETKWRKLPYVVAEPGLGGALMAVRIFPRGRKADPGIQAGVLRRSEGKKEIAMFGFISW